MSIKETQLVTVPILEARFAASTAQLDARFAELAARMDQFKSELQVMIEQMKAELVRWLFWVVIWNGVISIALNLVQR